MKKVEAIVQISEVEDVQEGLREIGVKAMSVTEVRSYGRKVPVEAYRGRRYEAPYVSEAKVEIVVPDEAVESVLEVIGKTSVAGEAGDGRTLVFSLDGVGRPQAENRVGIAA